MKFELYIDAATNDLVFSGLVTARGLEKIKFTRADYALMRAPHATAADVLLMLEMLFRRTQEMAERNQEDRETP